MLTPRKLMNCMCGCLFFRFFSCENFIFLCASTPPFFLVTNRDMFIDIKRDTWNITSMLSHSGWISIVHFDIVDSFCVAFNGKVIHVWMECFEMRRVFFLAPLKAYRGRRFSHFLVGFVIHIFIYFNSNASSLFQNVIIRACKKGKCYRLQYDSNLSNWM